MAFKDAFVMRASLVAAMVVIAAAHTAQAAPFLPSYTGPANEALELTSISVTFDGTNFDLASVSAAPIGGAPAGTNFVWGINRGGGTARFNVAAPTASNPAIGSNVLFDSVLSISATGTAVVNLLTGTATPLPAADLTIAGNTINALLPAALLPANGFDPSGYTFDLWPRVGSGQNSQIAQFDGVTNSTNPVNLAATPVPEPGSLLLLGGTLGLLTLAWRRGRVDA